MANPKEKDQYVATHEIALQLVLLKNRLAKLGRWKSVHAIDEATKVFGWEAAEVTKNATRR